MTAFAFIELNQDMTTVIFITDVEDSLNDAMSAARDEFSKFRGKNAWYNDLHPMLKGLISCCKALAGIIAAVTVIPAVLTSKYSHQGYIGTFFKTQTNSLYDLELFKEGLNGKDEVIPGLKGLMSS